MGLLRCGAWLCVLGAARALEPTSAATDPSFELTFDVAFRAFNRQTPFEAVLNGPTPKYGSFTVRFRPDWAPIGVARVRELAAAKFFEGNRFYRVVEGFIAQFGLHGDPTVTAQWRDRTLQDDPRRRLLATNRRGTVTFAQTSQKNSRTTQLFINLGDNKGLDSQGFVPVGEVIAGMDVVDLLYSGYGELDGFPQGQMEEPGDGPNQERIESDGNSYLDDRFPLLSYISAVCETPPCAAVDGRSAFSPPPAAAPLIGQREESSREDYSREDYSREDYSSHELIGVSAAGALMALGVGLAFLIGWRRGEPPNAAALAGSALGGGEGGAWQPSRSACSRGSSCASSGIWISYSQRAPSRASSGAWPSAEQSSTTGCISL